MAEPRINLLIKKPAASRHTQAARIDAPKRFLQLKTTLLENLFLLNETVKSLPASPKKIELLRQIEEAFKAVQELRLGDKINRCEELLTQVLGKVEAIQELAPRIDQKIVTEIRTAIEELQELSAIRSETPMTEPKVPPRAPAIVRGAQEESLRRQVVPEPRTARARPEVVFDPRTKTFEIADRRPNAVRITHPAEIIARQARVNAPEALRTVIQSAARLIVDHQAQPRTRTLVAEFVRTTIREIASPPAEVIHVVAEELSAAAKRTENVIDTGAKPAYQAQVEVARQVVKSLPAAASLPALIHEANRLNSEGQTALAKEVIIPLIREIAKTAPAKMAIINAIAGTKPTPLVTTDIGQKVLIETARALVEQAAVEVKSNARLLTQNAPRLTLVAIRQLVAANETRFSPANLNFANAQALLGFVGRLQEYLLPAARHQAAVGRKVHQTVKTPVAIVGRRAAPAVTASAPQNSAEKARIAAGANSLKEVLKFAREQNIVIPDKVITSIYSAEAGIRPLFKPAMIAPVLQLPAETAANSSLARIIKVLEAQAARPVSAIQATDPKVTARITISAAVFLYGTIMRLAKGNIEKVDEIMEILRKRQRLHSIISNIKGGKTADREADIDEISLLILETNIAQPALMAA